MRVLITSVGFAIALGSQSKGMPNHHIWHYSRSDDSSDASCSNFDGQPVLNQCSMRIIEDPRRSVNILVIREAIHLLVLEVFVRPQPLYKFSQLEQGNAIAGHVPYARV
jgi:hypothetical protein